MSNAERFAKIEAQMAENRAANKAHFETTRAIDKKILDETRGRVLKLEQEIKTMKLKLVLRQAILTTNFDKARLGRDKRRYLQKQGTLSKWAHANWTDARGKPLPDAASAKNPMYATARKHLQTAKSGGKGEFTSNSNGNARNYVKLVNARVASPGAKRDASKNVPKPRGRVNRGA